MNSGRVVTVLPQMRIRLDLPIEVALAEECAEGSRVLVFASATLLRSGRLDAAIASLGARCIGTFDGLCEHTPLPKVLEGAKLARDAKADLLVAIGGGSVIDGAKCVQAALADDLASTDDFARLALTNPGRTPLRASPFRTIAVPTTLSGAEFTCRAGFTDPASGMKNGIGDPQLVPRTVILDPDLARATPHKLWLSSGIRALDHAVEAICSPDAWPALWQVCGGALSLLSQGLRLAKGDPDDLTARSLAMQGVWLAASQLDNVRTGASHGLGYLLGALGGIQHGLTSCLLLPAVMRWNAPVTQAAQANLSGALGAPDAPAADLVEALIADLGLATSLATLGVSDALLEQIAVLAMHHPVVRANPRAFSDVHAVRNLLGQL